MAVFLTESERERWPSGSNGEKNNAKAILAQRTEKVKQGEDCF
jgi:hypothetical protein